MPEMEIIIQGQENFDGPVSRLPILPRLDRLDRLLQLLEEKHKLSKRLSTEFNKKAEPEDRQYLKVYEFEDPRKSLSSVLEEVHLKGTLMERLTMLENRVIQLSLDMDEGNTSGSSSSTNIPISDKLGLDSVWSTISIEGDVDKIASAHEKENSGDANGGVSTEGSSMIEHRNLKGQYVRKGKGSKSFKKMFGWFSFGC